MSDSPDYKTYSWQQLLDALQHIDRAKYPEQFALLAQEIQRRENDPTPAIQNAQRRTGSCTTGCASAVAAFVLCCGFGFLILSLLHPTPAPNTDGLNTDGLNRWGGHVATVMFAFIFGGVGGAFVTAGNAPLKTIAITTAIFAAVMLLLSG